MLVHGASYMKIIAGVLTLMSLCVLQPAAPPEVAEVVVQQADREILKLQAQAQAQAVAAAEVSAAAQRAEAEVQKHAQAHAQASATAQQLQAKAVHLQVQAEHLTVEAAAATVSIGVGDVGVQSMQRATSSAGLMVQGAVPGLPAVGPSAVAAPLLSSSMGLSAQVRTSMGSCKAPLTAHSRLHPCRRLHCRGISVW
jgi:uncharacterized membrane protein YqiK